ncbi:MAG: phosphoribosylaminoimidazolesuccinocarboxamide synthase [Endomicrobium sp.]|jgi:phosphoribosylaminoimidazole-succinocarboxamide synthase|uniref:phosphoribosylaminoimidazolesuccinocarboxamide synthase n=1 Tax=Candidatus Endomicrobiellum cubanum TaxID=3242325 RepID=UPI0028229869|nr:phosphoribosylaminoimidazolesuccinocarboxamide synthase [Endomicrobium sp.]
MAENKEDIEFPLVHKGKVRNVYDLGQSYLIVATDRISAFDHIIPTLIPNKGKILHKLSMFWFDFVKDIIPNHIITGDFDSFPSTLKKYEYLKDRSMIVKKAKRVDIECIVRGYLAGSGWKEYKESQTVCGIKLPKGLKESSKISEPIFTPSSKEEGGKHDENISFEETVKRVGIKTAENLKNISLSLYKRVNEYAISKGIILADTKLEFGFYNDKLLLIDEIFTPDSSRFWEIGVYKEGQPQDSLDKQYVRDYLENIKWDKTSPAPMLPKDVVDKTLAKYINAYEKLTGRFLV